MLYLHSFKLIAPFDNDVIQTCTAHWDYWKTNGFVSQSPENLLKDSIGTYSAEFSKRISSHKLGPYTLSDFQKSTQPGDIHASYIFSIISTEKSIVERVIKEILPVFLAYKDRKNKEDGTYQITEVRETIFSLNGITFEELKTYQEKIKRYEKLLEQFPFVDKLYEWLLVNRDYPTVK